jgi:hypothetical protein
MKIIRILNTACLLALAAPFIHAQTLNWGSLLDTMLADSNGDEIDSSFEFELGAFNLGFIPDGNNMEDWDLNWKIFDTASYNQDFGYFTSTVHVLSDVSGNVTSSNPNASPGNFAGLVAYLWIRNEETPGENTEWLLVRAGNWTFPLTAGDCCDTSVIEWSVSDLNSGNTPLYGKQGGVTGPGSYGYTSTSGLQTHGFVPEPSAALLSLIACAVTLLRRRRATEDI